MKGNYSIPSGPTGDRRVVSMEEMILPLAVMTPK
jgi:hypothetical protein